MTELIKTTMRIILDLNFSYHRNPLFFGACTVTKLTNSSTSQKKIKPRNRHCAAMAFNKGSLANLLNSVGNYMAIDLFAAFADNGYAKAIFFY